MAKTTRHFIELSDISGFLVTCPHCSLEYKVSCADAAMSLPMLCPGCTGDWSLDQKIQPVRDIQAAFEKLNSLQKGNQIIFGFHLEINPAVFRNGDNG